MSDSVDERERRRFNWPVVCLVVLVLYVLSAGPLHGLLVGWGIISPATWERMVDTVYLPLKLTGERFPKFRDLYIWYATLFNP